MVPALGAVSVYQVVTPFQHRAGSWGDAVAPVMSWVIPAGSEPITVAPAISSLPDAVSATEGGAATVSAPAMQPIVNVAATRGSLRMGPPG
jgi:hypothetical protein